MGVVRSEGIEALTMPRLAKEADVAVGGLYRYFEGKDALIAALQVRAAEAFVRFVEREVDPEAPALDRIRAIADAWAAFRTESPERHSLLDASLSDPRALLSDAEAQAVADAIAPALGFVAEAFDDAAQQGLLEPGDPEIRTHALWAAVHGVGHFAKRARLQPDKLHAAAVRAELVDALLRGWGRP